nr:PREDICTED: extracellular fatty acid-binding protein-like [Opisthocomus hoazin]
MRTVGLSLGLALLCWLRVDAGGPGAVGLDKSKIEGRWYIVALASDSEGYRREQPQLKMAMATIKVLDKGNLKVSFAIPSPKGCRKSQWIYRQTGVPGEYYCRERQNTRVQLVDTDGETYMVIFASKLVDGKTLHMLRLYSRTREVSPRITARFRKLAREKNFTDEMVSILPRQDKCTLDKA